MNDTRLTFQVTGDSRLVFQQEGRPALTISFIRTLRIPDDGKSYPLPPGLGTFPIRRVADYADRVPRSWLDSDGVFLPIYQREAMWLSFQATDWSPYALKVAAGGINALSGQAWSSELAATEDEPDYLVVPVQPWLDGFNTGEGRVRQFVAMPLGSGYTVEGQITGEEKRGGTQLRVFPGKHDRFPAPVRYRSAIDVFRPRPGTESLQDDVLRLLLEEGRVDQNGLDSAREHPKAAELPLGLLRALLQTGQVSSAVMDNAIVRAHAHLLGLPFCDLAQNDPEMTRLVPEGLARRYKVLPVAIEADVMTLACADPHDFLAQEDIALITGFKVRPAMAAEEEIVRILDEHFGVDDLFDVECTMKDISAQDFGHLEFCADQEMGMAAGGQVEQKITPDPYGLDCWDQEAAVEVEVHMVDAFTWAKITGEAPPSTPVDARAYSQAGYPWFDYYNDTHTGDLTPSQILAQVESMAAMDTKHGKVDPQNASLTLAPNQVVTYVSSEKPIGQG